MHNVVELRDDCRHRTRICKCSAGAMFARRWGHRPNGREGWKMICRIDG